MPIRMKNLRNWVVGPTVLAILGCATNPVTGKRELSLISESQEIAMGQQAAVETRRTIGVVTDTALLNYVATIGLRMARASERPSLPWSFDVVDDAAVNAFALPGGSIFVTRGLLTHMINEAELATVLGHEIGHVTAKHSVQQLSRAQVAQAGLAVGSLLSSSFAQLAGVASQGLGLLLLKYGRDAETQADDLGFRYSLNQGYDVREMKSMFELLQRVSNLSSGGRLPQWLASHPDPENRIARTDQRLAGVTRDLSKATVNRDPFLRRIDGQVFGENPRHGYFDGQRFNHPDLQFRIDFPPGWQTQNQPSAVVAVSPQQDAIFTLSIPGSDSPEVLLGKFLQQQGVQGGNQSRTSVNGMPAAAADFQAHTEQGQTVAGRVVFLGYGGNSYRLLGYAEGSKYGGYASEIRQAIQSFDRLTDQAALTKQPMRVRLVRMTTDLTVEEFNRQFPSVVSVATVAIINGKDGATGLLKAGSWVKRVM